MIFPDKISHTQISEFQLCPRKWWYNKVEKVIPPDPVSIHLHFGACWADALDRLRKGKSKKEVEELFKKEFICQGHPEKNLVNGLRMIDSFEEKFDIVESEKFIGIDLPILHPVTGKKIIYTGRLDFMAKDEDGLFIGDDKTMKYANYINNITYEMFPQLLSYIYCLESKGMKLARKYVIQGWECSFNAHSRYKVFKVEQWHLEEWYRNTLWIINQMVDAYKKREIVQNWNSCMSFGAVCPFRLLCTSNKKDRRTIMKTYKGG